MEHSYRLQLLFDKYLHGKCTQAEVKEFTDLLEKSGADNELNEPMLALWQRLKNDKTDYPVDWEKMYSRVQNAENDLFKTSRRRKSKVRELMPRLAAAMIILLAGAGSYWYLREVKEIAKNQSLTTSNYPPAQSDTRQTIYLPDGSTVILNKGSKLNYPATFNGQTREVYLIGEGYFDIVNNPRQPFLVHSGKLTIKVLGTAFDIKAYPNDERIEVTVTRGKVQVMKGKQNLGFLTANQQIAYTQKTGATEQRTVDTKPIIAWKPGEIIFDDITMQEAAAQIEKRFNMEVVFENIAIKDCRVSATFSEDDMPDEMLSVICAVSKAGYLLNDNKITIYGKGCK